MCQGCWEFFGRPYEVVPATLGAVEAVRHLHLLHAAGGPAAAVTEEWNLDDDDLDRCRDELSRADCPEEHRDAAWRALERLRPLTEEQRATVLAIHAGCAPEPG